MDKGLTQYLKERVETLDKRNKKLLDFEEWVLKNHPQIINDYRRRDK